MAGWYIRRGDSVIGPADVAKLKELAASGKLLRTDELAKDAAGPWTQASRMPLFAPTPGANIVPPALPTVGSPAPPRLPAVQPPTAGAAHGRVPIALPAEIANGARRAPQRGEASGTTVVDSLFVVLILVFFVCWMSGLGLLLSALGLLLGMAGLSIASKRMGIGIGPSTTQTTTMIERLPAQLETALKQNLRPNETVHIMLRGAHKEALVCTDTRVIILKAGFMTGQFFGSNVFQLPYSQVAGVEVKFHLVSGYFEVSAAGMENRAKSYWSQKADYRASNALNCVALLAGQAARFRQACAFILETIDRKNAGPPPQSRQDQPTESEIIGALERLGELRGKGVLTEDEFLAKKAELLSRM